jgi:hypothetical protein
MRERNYSKLNGWFYESGRKCMRVPVGRSSSRDLPLCIVLYVTPQRHLLRERRRGTTACPACWATMRATEVKQCTVRNKIFVLGRLKHPKQDKNLLFCHDEPNEPTNTFMCTPQSRLNYTIIFMFQGPDHHLVPDEF